MHDTEKITVIDRAVKLIEKTRGIKIRPDQIPLDDRRTLLMLAQGAVIGVLELDGSPEMRRLVKAVKPDRFADLSAMIALCRPGPLATGMVEQYLNRKHGREPITYLHPLLEPILSETYGVILYQEQVMHIATAVGGFPPADANLLRKAMGRKEPRALATYKDQFSSGAAKNGVPEETAVEIFDLTSFFTGYGLNKSFAAASATRIFQAAFLKANYPQEYLEALMEWEAVEYWAELDSLGIDFERPTPEMR